MTVAFWISPTFVLDADEIEMIQERIDAFNQIIKEVANNLDMPVVDINGALNDLSSNLPDFSDIPISTRYLGGIFSLDGVHPSNTGHAILANAFIQTINTHFDSNFPLISNDELKDISIKDPHVDKDGNGRVKGRAGAGLLESLGPILGISGDIGDTVRGEQFIRYYLSICGEDSKMALLWDKDDSITAFKHIFGITGFLTN